MSIPLQVRRDLWKWRHALSAFNLCHKTCAHIIEANLKKEDFLHHTLGIAAVITYGRPFKFAKGGIERLPEEVVPAQYKAIHQEAIKTRDQAYAHVDASMDARRADKPSCNVFYQVDGRERRFYVMEIRFTQKFITGLLELSSELAEKSKFHVHKLYEAHKKHFPIANATYLIGMDESEPAFQKVQTAHIQKIG